MPAPSRRGPRGVQVAGFSADIETFRRHRRRRPVPTVRRRGHRWQRWLHVGAQGFGEVGPWDRWLPQDQQSHRAGPALFGSLAIDPGKLNWQAAYLLGKTGGRRGRMFTMRVKYDF